MTNVVKTVIPEWTTLELNEKEMPMEIPFCSKQEDNVGQFGTAASNGTDSKRADFRLVGYLTLPY